MIKLYTYMKCVSTHEPPFPLCMYVYGYIYIYQVRLRTIGGKSPPCKPSLPSPYGYSPSAFLDPPPSPIAWPPPLFPPRALPSTTPLSPAWPPPPVQFWRCKSVPLSVSICTFVLVKLIQKYKYWHLFLWVYACLSVQICVRTWAPRYSVYLLYW
jgi:hypothetical protein